ncbi:Calmodulin-binding transcription activator 1 [Striga hermonthica]|uniref:Calmodulin-binding transcription activator 1 n=1 Tax=Striga hermonthica TaxID=68872 RepID=A0A9N7MNZ6_STRHE|nr:Calmodulin-binding transcription activator 1 [Striga hermonthica]
MILCLEPVGSPLSARNDFEKQSVIYKIVSLIEENNSQDAKLASGSNTLCRKVIGQQLLEKQLKEKFYSWLLLGVTSDGKGLMVIDKWGQSVLHLAATLGFNWAFQPIIESGVSIDFRDVNGWTALHWAAFYGREETVAVLVSLGAAPGALTDPSTEYPQGRTPSDLAYSSGHKGISGFLGETFLTTHLSTLTLNDGNTTEECGLEAIQTVTERLAAPTTGEDVPETLSLKDSIAAICNATQAAARIHQIFRIQSFQRKQILIENESGEWLDSDEQAISLLAAKTSRLGQSGGTANAAALSIQKKYRGWKKRKEFLLIRQKIVKIQAHVRGHQARKKYKPIIWSVGILEKVILRWRRKGTGLRGFRPDGIQKQPHVGDSLPPPEDDYDYLKEGRKQSEQRMQKALARVKSMAQYPEARAQYRRLLTAAEVFRENKDASDGIPDNMEDLMYPGDDLIDVSSLLDDGTFMPLAF